MGLNILLAEDDIFFQEKIYSILKMANKKFNIFISESKEESLETAKKEPIDIFIIDIGLRESDGLDLAKEIRNIRKYYFSQIIIISIYDKYKLMAYTSVRCFTFISKNGNWEIELKAALAGLINNLEPLEEQKISMTAIDKTIILIDKKNILYFESKDHRVIVCTIDGTLELKYITHLNLLSTLGEFFIRCHKSYIVNISHISSINFKERIITIKKANTAIPIGRLYLEPTKKAFYKYLHNINI